MRSIVESFAFKIFFLLDWASSKVDFCQKLILPKTVLAGKYIMLYRKLTQNNGLVVV